MTTEPRDDDPELDRTIPVGAGGQQPPPAEASPPMPNIPGVTLKRELARGGMGVVYVGRQDFLDRTVAVKLLSIDLQNDQFAARFQREAKLLAGIKHPNIVACHDAGVTDDGLYYLVMEYIDGPTLKEWIASNGPFPVPVALDMTKAVAKALDHAYGLGVIHRDVKPENILLETATSTRINAETPFIPKLVDLGLARMQSESAGLGLTSPGAVMGTPTTMSPEQFDDPDSVDFRTDVYGLGCVFYELLTGLPAFEAKKLTDLVVTKRRPLGPNPCEVLDWLSPRVGELVARMLAADRDDRPASYAELVGEIDHLVQEWSSATTLRPTGPPPGSTSSTPPSGPGAAPASAPDAAAANPEVTRGILRSTELNFLAQGSDEAAMPSSPFVETPAGTTATAAPAASRKRGGMMLALAGIVAVTAGAVGVGFWYAGDGDADPTRPDPGRPAAANAPPAAPRITGPTTLALRAAQTFGAASTDPDGDEVRYRWSSPQTSFVTFAPPDAAETSVFVLDGLEGTEFTVEVSATDGNGGEAVARTTITVGEIRPRSLLDGFTEIGSAWTDVDKRYWTKILDDGSVSGKAIDGPVRSSRPLPDEAYWHVVGLVEPQRMNNLQFGEAGVQLELGSRGWAVECRRSGDSGTDWSAELVEMQLVGREWQRRPEAAQPVRVAWTDENGECDGVLVTIKRELDRLEIGFGRKEKNGLRTTAISLPDPNVNATMSLFVRTERGIFRNFALF